MWVYIQSSVCQEKRTLYIYDALTYLAAGIFALCKAYMSLSFSLFLHNVTSLGSVIIENNVFFIENTEYYIKQKGTQDLRGLSYF